MTCFSGKYTGLLGFILLVGASGCAREPAPKESAPRESAPKAAAPAPAQGRDSPMLGGTIHRNPVNLVEKNVPDDWSIQKGKEKNVKWSALLGINGYGAPVIAGGKIFIGTNNEKPRDKAVMGDKGILMCFRAADGTFLWQAVHDKLENPDQNDWPRIGLISSPVVEGDRLYYVSNRCELVCADVEGDKGKAKFHWTLDMIKDLGVFPCQATASSPLILGDLVIAITCNGVDPQTHKVVNADAPSLIAVNRKTGKVVWKDNSPGTKIMEGQWTNPAAGEVNGVMHVIFPGGDGWLRGLDAKTGKLLWKFDCNPKKSVYKPAGRGDKCYFVATPVFHDNKVYIGVGLNPEDGVGVGHLWCIDISKKPANKDLDLSPVNDNFDPSAAVNKDSGLVWHFGGPVMPKPEDGEREIVFSRTCSTVAVVDGLCYAADLDGFLYCLDAASGKKHWAHDFKDGTLNSPYYVDGKVFMGVGNGDLWVFTHGKEYKKPKKIDMSNKLDTPPVVVNGVLYLSNAQNLFAIAPK